VVTTVEILLARSLIIPKRDEIAAVDLANCRMAVSIPPVPCARSRRRPPSRPPFGSPRPWSLVIAPMVVEIWLPVADTSRVEAACSATVASKLARAGEISVAEVVTCIPERCTCPMKRFQCERHRVERFQQFLALVFEIETSVTVRGRHGNRCVALDPAPNRQSDLVGQARDQFQRPAQTAAQEKRHPEATANMSNPPSTELRIKVRTEP